MDIKNILEKIEPLDKEAMKIARDYNDNLVKPIGSLGRLEEIAIKISGITSKLHNQLDKKAIIIMCADNGVYEEGVSTAPQEVTKTQALNFFKGVTGVAVLARQSNIDLKVVDIGIKGELSHPLLIKHKIAHGTKNTAQFPAMTEEQMEDAVLFGFQLVGELKEEGYQIIGTGEMGISNTTTAESIIICLSGCTVEEAVGKGAGLTEALYEHKKDVIRKILKLHNPDHKNPLEVLQKVGGFDIAGLVGCFLGAAYHRIPIVIDGVISASAALVAYALHSTTAEFMLPSHLSEEAGYGRAMECIGIRPYFDLKMRLGEGSGCPFTFYLAEAAVRIVNEMVSFEQGNVDKSKYIDIREEWEI